MKDIISQMSAHLLLVALTFFLGITIFGTVFVAQTLAQESDSTIHTTDAVRASSSVSVDAEDNLTTSSQIKDFLETKDLTKPEEDAEKEDTLQLLERRPIQKPGLFSFPAWWVQHSIRIGIPVNTVVLILLLPILAAIVAFIRVIIGLPSLEMLVPIALAYVFVSVGIVIGAIILTTVLIASYISRMLLRRLAIMHYPKRSLSMLILATLVFMVLTISIQFKLGDIQNISIFPILILTLLGDSIVSVQLHKGVRETSTILAITIGLGLLGYLLATLELVRTALILYPEIILLMIPVNIIMGRYFGLRLSEVFRFRNYSSYGSE